MEIRIPVAGSTIDGYLAEPAGEGPHPGVVVIHDAFGLTADARAITDRFAADGFLALSPNMYARGGIRCVKRVFTDLFAGKGLAFDDIEASRLLLAGREDCSGKVGIAGFCLGGGFALVAATQEFDAAAPYYGQLPKDMSILDDSCPVVASFGKKDFTLRGAAAKLESALAARNIPHDVKEYPDAGHSFANQFQLGPLNLLVKVTGFGYQHDASEDAWRRVTTFFGEHLNE